MLIASETKVNHASFATGFGDRDGSSLGLKVGKGFPATHAIAELGPEAGYQGSAFCARQALGHLSYRARGEKTLNLVVVDLDRFNRRAQLVNKNLGPLGFIPHDMLGYGQLGWGKFVPQLLTAFFAQMMLLARKAIEILVFERIEIGRSRVASQEVQSDIGVEIAKGIQRSRVILFERNGELIEQASFLAHHASMIPTQKLKLLGFVRSR